MIFLLGGQGPAQIERVRVVGRAHQDGVVTRGGGVDLARFVKADGLIQGGIQLFRAQLVGHADHSRFVRSPAGSGTAITSQNPDYLTVFVAGFDGAIAIERWRGLA